MLNVPVPLNLPNVEIVDVQQKPNGDLMITVETTEKSVQCRHCKREITKRHGTDKKRELQYLPVFEKATTIIYHHHRYICEIGFIFFTIQRFIIKTVFYFFYFLRRS